MPPHVYQTQILERIDRYGIHTHSDRHSDAMARCMLGTRMKFAGNRTIYVESESADYVYEIANGAVRTVKILPDGRRQIGGFYFAADIFGLGDRHEHTFSAEAIADSEIRIIKKGALIQMAGDNRELAERLLMTTAGEIARLHNHALMLIKTAEERLSTFLLEMAERISIGHVIELPMSRQDIADYLGLTIETVSRSFRTLADRSMIRLLNSRTVILRDVPVLTGNSGHAMPRLNEIVSLRPRGAPTQGRHTTL